MSVVTQEYLCLLERKREVYVIKDRRGKYVGYDSTLRSAVIPANAHRGRQRNINQPAMTQVVVLCFERKCRESNPLKNTK